MNLIQPPPSPVSAPRPAAPRPLREIFRAAAMAACPCCHAPAGGPCIRAAAGPDGYHLGKPNEAYKAGLITYEELAAVVKLAARYTPDVLGTVVRDVTEDAR